MKEFGRGGCLKNFLEVVAKLESDEGLSLNIQGKYYIFHGKLLCVAGDNLSMNDLGGFKCGFVFAKRPCRLCMILHDDLSKFLVETDVVLKNESYHKKQ